MVEKPLWNKYFYDNKRNYSPLIEVEALQLLKCGDR